MQVFEIDITKKFYDTATKKVVHKTTTKQITLPEEVSEIKLKKWSEYHLKREDIPKWITDVEAIEDDEKRMEEIKKWPHINWSQFIYHVGELMSVVTGVNIIETLGIKNVDKQDVDSRSLDALLALYIVFNKMIIGYQPKKISEFKWKGATYVIPQDLVDSIGRVWTGAEMNTVTAIEALQVEHVFNAKDEEGEFILKDRKYRTDTALIACLARKVTKKKDEEENDLLEIEQMPLDMIKRRKWLDNRIKIFGEIPMDIGLDIAFFLTNLKKDYINILSSSMRSMMTQKALQKQYKS